MEHSFREIEVRETKVKKRKIKKTTKKVEKKGIKKWFLIYNGSPKIIKFPGIGRIIPGKEYPISAAKANQFKNVDSKKGFKVIGRYVYDK